MFWRLRKFLFGTDFVHLENSADDIIRAVRRTAAGERYCVYFSHNLIFIDRNDCGWIITPLTWLQAPRLRGVPL